MIDTESGMCGAVVVRTKSAADKYAVRYASEFLREVCPEGCVYILTESLACWRSRRPCAKRTPPDAGAKKRRLAVISQMGAWNVSIVFYRAVSYDSHVSRCRLRHAGATRPPDSDLQREAQCVGVARLTVKMCGKTLVQATTGRASRGELVPFGECVDARVPGEHKCRAVENWRAGFGLERITRQMNIWWGVAMAY